MPLDLKASTEQTLPVEVTGRSLSAVTSAMLPGDVPWPAFLCEQLSTKAAIVGRRDSTVFAKERSVSPQGRR